MLVWQVQLSGSKTWNLVPMPECNDVCVPLAVTADEGDISMHVHVKNICEKLL